MNVISLAQVKAQLGISDTSKDTIISAKIPFIDAKVKQITNNNYNYRFASDVTSGSNTITGYALYKSRDSYPSINNSTIVRDITKSLEVGMLVTGTNIPADTYITDFYKYSSTDSFSATTDTVYIELSENVTDDGTGIVITGGISIAYHDVIAKGIQYLINETSTTLPETGAYDSLKMGPTSITLGGSGSVIDGKYGMPVWFVKGLPSRTL